MTDAERIAQLEYENALLKKRLKSCKTKYPDKTIRVDPLNCKNVKEDFHLPDCCNTAHMSSLRQILIMLLFPETTFKAYSGGKIQRVVVDTMSDKQFELYHDTINSIYNTLLDARKVSLDNNLYCWDLNSPNTLKCVINSVQKDGFEFPYIHEGEELPRKGE